MNKTKLLIIGIVLLILMPLTLAKITVNIKMQSSFSLGEDISYNYTMISDTDTKTVMIPHIECPSAPIPPMIEKRIELQADQYYFDTYFNMVVDDSIESQVCTAYIQMLEPIEQRVEKTFEIKTNPSFGFNIILDKKIFIKNEDITIHYNSEIPNPEIIAKLTYPDGDIRNIEIPISIKAEQIGTYNLEVTAYKEGYKINTQKVQFGVIEKEANIPYVKEIKKEKGLDWLWIIIITVIILVIIIIIDINIKKKEGRKKRGR